MSDKKVSYGEYVILGINKAMLAFLVSFLLCLGLSLVINLHFYEELIALTVGGLGAESSAGIGTILRTAALILGLSNFQMSGKFQLGLLLLAVIPFLAFWISGLLFRAKKQESTNTEPVGIHVVIDGLAALIYSVFVLISGLVARGELFGFLVNFASGRNFVFTLLFAVFVQFFLGMNEKETLTVLASGLVRTRKLLRLILSFSALTGILFILYYLTPYVKGVFKIILLIIVILPNLAVYLSFLLMGITIDVGESFQELSAILPMIRLNAFVIPTSIRVVLILTFIIIVLIMLVRIPIKQYWQNLSIFVICFSVSVCLLAMASRMNLGFTGMLNVSLEISLWKAFFVPFTLLSLDGILLALLRALCREVNENKTTGLAGVISCGPDSVQTEMAEEEKQKDDFKDTNGQEWSVIQEESDEEQAREKTDVLEEDKEIDIWKELAARPIPSSVIAEEKAKEKEKSVRKSFFGRGKPKSEKKEESLEDPDPFELALLREESASKEMLIKEESYIEDDGSEEYNKDSFSKEELYKDRAKKGTPKEEVFKQELLKEESFKEECFKEKSPKTFEEVPQKEIDISLFPRKKKPIYPGVTDFSNMDDDIFPDEYEAEETLDDFVDWDDAEESVLEKKPAEERESAFSDLLNMGQTKVIRKAEVPEEAGEKTITYNINHRIDK